MHDAREQQPTRFATAEQVLRHAWRQRATAYPGCHCRATAPAYMAPESNSIPSLPLPSNRPFACMAPNWARLTRLARASAFSASQAAARASRSAARRSLRICSLIFSSALLANLCSPHKIPLAHAHPAAGGRTCWGNGSCRVPPDACSYRMKDLMKHYISSHLGLIC